ncbi:MAG TPA: hypothetical protein VJ487_20640, partial [Alphaproteobacteria bacterium]|nr:hypothetical protein [Alphaproteobacteria bacterium]
MSAVVTEYDKASGHELESELAALAGRELPAERLRLEVLACFRRALEQGRGELRRRFEARP